MSEYEQYEMMVKDLQGGTTEEEKAALQSLFIARSDLKDEYEGLKAAWDSSQNYKQGVNPDVDAAWTKVKSNISTAQSTKVVPMHRKWSVAIAAAFILLLGIGFLLRLSSGESKWNTVATKGDTKRIQLSDGSVVWLNQHSSLSYREEFKDNRGVRLTGEAFFEVAKDPRHPFTIVSAGTATRVLGTSFNVRAYPAEGNVEVSVAKGRVSFGDTAAEQNIILLPGDMGKYDIAARNMSKIKAGSNSLAWKTGTLVFNTTPLNDVMRDLERYYNISLKLREQSTTAISFTGKLEKQPLNSALDIVKSSLGLRIIRDSAQTYSVYIH